jgi:hypothetical protein
MSLRSSSIADRDKGFSLKMPKPNVGRTQLRIHRVPAALFGAVKRRARVSARTTPSRTEVKNAWSCTSAISCAFVAYSGTTLLHYKACFILGSSQDLIHPHGLILPEGFVLFMNPGGISEQYVALGHDHLNILLNALLVNHLITGLWNFLQRFQGNLKE